MKKFTKLLIFIVVLLGLALPMFLKGPDGKPIMALSDWVPDVDQQVLDMDKLGSSLEQLTSGAGGESPFTAPQTADEPSTKVVAAKSGSGSRMYKWQDEKGRWHFSSEKPPQHIQAAEEELPEMENLMEAPVKAEENSSTIGLPGGFSL